jgi:NAD(P)-dependent dehydrogenase (short-subunit alcohol dehydrogenase family)
MAAFGRIDILVNNAGVSSAAPASRETPEAFARVIDINLNGCYWMAQACGRVKGIRVNALAPGFFPSEMTDEYRPGYLDGQLGRVPMGRTGDPEELTAALVFLASDASSYVNGQTLVVDGGLTIA